MVEHVQFAEFVDRTYKETIILLEEAREYTMLYGTNHMSSGYPESDRCLIIREMFRLTTRLSAMIAWLLIQKGVAVGEISAEQAHKDQNRLLGHSVCAESVHIMDVALPPILDRLLEKSRELFDQASKMDRMSARLFVGAKTTETPGT